MQGIRSLSKIQFHFNILETNNWTLKLFNIPFTIASQYKLLRDKSDKSCERFII